MKLIFSMLVVILVLASCSITTQESKESADKAQAYPIIKVRDCEYIVVESGIADHYQQVKSYSLIHCADCRNPIHTK